MQNDAPLLTQCLPLTDLVRFIDQINIPFDIITDKLIVVYANVGPVFWSFNDVLGMFCHSSGVAA